jgi:hypothetical protein
LSMTTDEDRFGNGVSARQSRATERGNACIFPEGKRQYVAQCGAHCFGVSQRPAVRVWQSGPEPTSPKPGFESIAISPDKWLWNTRDLWHVENVLEASLN